MKVNRLEIIQMIRELEQKLLDLLWKEEMREMFLQTTLIILGIALMNMHWKME